MPTATRSPTTSASSIPQIFGFSRELSICRRDRALRQTFSRTVAESFNIREEGSLGQCCHACYAFYVVCSLTLPRGGGLFCRGRPRTGRALRRSGAAKFAAFARRGVAGLLSASTSTLLAATGLFVDHGPCATGCSSSTATNSLRMVKARPSRSSSPTGRPLKSVIFELTDLSGLSGVCRGWRTVQGDGLSQRCGGPSIVAASHSGSFRREQQPAGGRNDPGTSDQDRDGSEDSSGRAIARGDVSNRLA
jgi:hypothetical protein